MDGWTSLWTYQTCKRNLLRVNIYSSVTRYLIVSLEEYPSPILLCIQYLLNRNERVCWILEPLYLVHGTWRFLIPQDSVLLVVPDRYGDFVPCTNGLLRCIEEFSNLYWLAVSNLILCSNAASPRHHEVYWYFVDMEDPFSFIFGVLKSFLAWKGGASRAEAISSRIICVSREFVAGY